ncbi:methyltransferase domain-containing protein [Acidobacteria bacterium AB60]|nr:methyltransferase domain-containing protein [Acidobacteria bacterium AB60]
MRPDQLLARIATLDLLEMRFPENRCWGRNDALDPALSRAVDDLRARLEHANRTVYDSIRDEIRRGDQPQSLFHWVRLALEQENSGAQGYSLLDEIISGVLQFEEPQGEPPPISLEMVAYQPTPARHIFAMIQQLEFTPQDVLMDLGSGLGHVPLLVSICTNARSVGVERDPGYVKLARQCAQQLNLSRATFLQQDVSDADFSTATVFYLYTPFTGSILRHVLDRLRQEARGRSIRVCSYGPCTATIARESWLIPPRGAHSPEFQADQDRILIAEALPRCS